MKQLPCHVGLGFRVYWEPLHTKGLCHSKMKCIGQLLRQIESRMQKENGGLVTILDFSSAPKSITNVTHNRELCQRKIKSIGQLIHLIECGMQNQRWPPSRHMGFWLASKIKENLAHSRGSCHRKMKSTGQLLSSDNEQNAKNQDGCLTDIHVLPYSATATEVESS